MRETRPLGAICAGWWHQTIGINDGAARMTRTRLRHCTTPAEALTVEAVHDLNARLRAEGYRPSADRLALVSIVLAHVAAAGSRRLPEAFGRRRSRDEVRVLSELRFQALIHTTGSTDLIIPLRRAMAVVRRTPINVAALATDLYEWDEDIRTKWCFRYFAAASFEGIPGETAS